MIWLYLCRGAQKLEKNKGIFRIYTDYSSASVGLEYCSKFEWTEKCDW